MIKLTTTDFFAQAADIPVLDVRSPGEYDKGHFPGAHSFPLFNNDERSIIGTLYKQVSRRDAVKKGLEIVGPKLVSFVESAEQFGSPKLALYCWRGGMRSASMAQLLESYGFETCVLQGGYKAYRTAQRDYYEQALPLRVITGFTGSKKTHLLHLLRENGAQAIDLEGLAGHQGSSFGNRKSEGQPTTEQFQNQLFEAFRKLDRHQPIWIEDEGARIGQVYLPEGLFRQMSTSPHLYLEVPKEQRISFLVEDYGDLPAEKLLQATYYIRKRLGPQNTEKAMEYIRSGNPTEAADIILTYYDRRYEKSIAAKEEYIAQRIATDLDELPALARKMAAGKIL